MSETALPPIGKHYEELMKQMWSYEILSPEDYTNIWMLIAHCASPVEDVQREYKEISRYLGQAGFYWRRMRLLREEAEEELEKLFYVFYSSVRSTKYSEESRVEDELPMPVLKNIQKTRKNEAPKGAFSRDLVKSFALQDHSYCHQATRTRWLKYFEGQLEELRTAISQRQSSLDQWSNNNRQKIRNTGDA